MAGLNMRGIVVPLVTPLIGGAVDDAALDALVERAVAAGAGGLFVMGTTGEFAGLDVASRRAAAARACAAARGRVPVAVHVSDPCVATAAALAAAAAAAGAAAVVVAAPYYLPCDAEELIDYVDAVLAAQPLPVVLYNFPALTKVGYAPMTVARLAERPRVVGIKDSSGDATTFRAFRAAGADRPDWLAFAGSESLLIAAARAGAAGCVAGGGNLAAAALVRLWAAASAGDLATGPTCVDALAGLYQLGGGSGVVDGIRAIKGALAVQGVCGPDMVAPHRACTNDQLGAIAHHLGHTELCSV